MTTKTRMEKNTAQNNVDQMKEDTVMTNMNSTDTATTITIAEILAEKSQNKAAGVREGLVKTFRYFRARQGIEESAEQLDVLAEELQALLASLPDEELAHGANVVFAKTAFWEGGFESDHMVVGFEANTRYNPEERVNGVYPMVLWVHVKPVSGEVRLPKTTAEKAVAYFEKRLPDLPQQVLLELFEYCWDGEEITICQHPAAKPVVLKSKEAPGGQFLLQDVGADGTFVPNRPIAYCVGNRAYVSVPGAAPTHPWTFRANPVK